jgi:hypothetical protein
MRLLTLPPDIVFSISNLTINPSTAEELLSINDSNEQLHIGKEIQDKRLSSRTVRALIRNKNRSNIVNLNKGNSVDISGVDISFDNLTICNMGLNI